MQTKKMLLIKQQKRFYSRIKKMKSAYLLPAVGGWNNTNRGEIIKIQHNED